MAYFLRALFLVSVLSCTLNAKDLGTYGHTYPIIEKSLLDHIKEKIGQLSKDESEEILEKLQTRYIELITQPRSVGLKECQKTRVAYYDPSICLFEDIKDADGKVIIPKGTSYNPLSVTALREDLLFFDGSNPKHVAWAKENQGKWILTNGKPIELEISENRPVYFDQMGTISKKLGIKAIPAKVSQENMKLRIEEMPCF